MRRQRRRVGHTFRVAARHWHAGTSSGVGMCLSTCEGCDPSWGDGVKGAMIMVPIVKPPHAARHPAHLAAAPPAALPLPLPAAAVSEATASLSSGAAIS